MNKQGRYLASLNEQDPHRDLRQRQDIAAKLSKDLENKFGVAVRRYAPNLGQKERFS